MPAEISGQLNVDMNVPTNVLFAVGRDSNCLSKERADTEQSTS